MLVGTSGGRLRSHRPVFLTSGCPNCHGWMNCVAFTGIRKDSGFSTHTRGIGAFILTPDLPGYGIGKKEDKMGLRASPTVQLHFDNLRVPRQNLLGEPGMGFIYAMQSLDAGRLGIAAQAVGIAQAALTHASKYAAERRQFGKPIKEFQAIQFKLADMATELEAARWLTYRAAYLRDTGQPFLKEAAMAKLKASRLAVSAASEAVQIHGGVGYMLESPVARFYCDAKVLEIGEGTNEIQHLVIARALGC